jgi:hypothetical protein
VEEVDELDELDNRLVRDGGGKTGSSCTESSSGLESTRRRGLYSKGRGGTWGDLSSCRLKLLLSWRGFPGCSLSDMSHFDLRFERALGLKVKVG